MTSSTRPNDWANLPPWRLWNEPYDPVVLAVGDGPANEASSNAVAARLATIDPTLFLSSGTSTKRGRSPRT